MSVRKDRMLGFDPLPNEKVSSVGGSDSQVRLVRLQVLPPEGSDEDQSTWFFGSGTKRYAVVWRPRAMAHS